VIGREGPGGALAETPALEVRGVTKSYGDFVLDDVSLTLPRGYIMGLVGPNGAGKSTLVRLILGVARRDGGEIRVLGMDPRDHEVAVRSRVGFVHEDPSFYDGLPVDRCARLLGSFYARWDHDRFRGLAADFELPLGKRVGALSRGMRTRFALTLALAHRPDLLVLDEPTSGLDPVFRRELLDRLSMVLSDGGTSILFSTHITSDLDRVADHITFLRRGRVVFSGRRDEVLEPWALVKGERGVLDAETLTLFRGLVESDYGFTGLTDDPAAARARLAGASIIIERATLEDVVFYTGRSGRGGMELRARRD
jgi:ABC-2 type transport system ATP-binding protein